MWCACVLRCRWKDWIARMRSGTETSHWINANTKPCPKCTKPVEKNGGCNLVLCMCGQAFCWLCGIATGRAHTWTNIEGHACGRFKEDADKRVDDAQRCDGVPSAGGKPHGASQWPGN